MRRLVVTASFVPLLVHAVAAPAPAGSDSIFAPANECLALRAADGRYVARAGEGYAATADTLAAAAAFYWEPTSLGSYLLLSGYTRSSGERGTKELLGLRDPAGEILDAAGSAVDTAGIHVSAAGDMADYAFDPVTPAGRTVRQAGENVSDAGGRIADRNVEPALAALADASDRAVWSLARNANGTFTLSALVTGQRLAAATDGTLGLASPNDAGAASDFTLVPATGCSPYPEAGLDAEIVGTRLRYWAEKDGGTGAVGEPVFGWVDAHAHVTAYEFIGGRINYGAPFHRFGVDHALDDCEENHGPQGSTGTVEMVTSDDAMQGHETRGWPTYADWPRSGSLQHHQSYHRWLERAFLSGQKILVNLITHNEILCQVVPQKKNDCDGMANIRLQARRTYELQDYVDAQAGGPGQGWFRVVESPADARRVIDEGKMAVVLGVEMSKVLNCGEFLDQPECTHEDIVERLDELESLGIRLVFPVHKFDNAFGGHLPHSGFAIGTVLTVGNIAETGHPLELEECPEEFDDDARGTQPTGLPDYLLWQLEYAGRQLPSDSNFDPYDPRNNMTTDLCNVRGLTPLGHFLTDELMRRRMLIDVDHMSRRAADRLLDLAEARGYPVISSHDWLGSERLLDRVARGGGFIGRFARGGRDAWTERLRGIAARQDGTGFYAGGGIASDVNGIAHLPDDPRRSDDARTIEYPFLSYDGAVLFHRQTTGDATFDLYDGRGVAHYGLYPDFIADTQQLSADPGALDVFFRSAEAYLRTWEVVTGDRPLSAR